MPAVTANPIDLPRLTAIAPGSRQRRVVSLTTAPKGHEGEGFPVRRALAGVAAHVLDPFILMDQMGSVDYGPSEPRGTDWHPHRGFETVTYIIDGTFVHQDSHGGGGVISNGATQWMTAGGGILHIETPPEEMVINGGLFHGIQLWVNLPSAQKMIEPAYQNLEADSVRLLASPDGGALVRLIAGEVDQHRGPGQTHTPITLAHATLAPGAQLELAWPRTFNSLVYTLSGRGFIGPNLDSIEVGTLAVLADGDHLVIRADNSGPLDVMLLGGHPIGEPVAQYGPFVMNTRDELTQAVDDFNAGRLGVIPPNGIRPYRGAP